MLKKGFVVPPTDLLGSRATLLTLVFAFSALLLLLVADLVAGEVLISTAGAFLRSRLTADPAVGFSFSPTAECLRLTADEGVLGELGFFERSTRYGVSGWDSALIFILVLTASWLTLASIS